MNQNTTKMDNGFMEFLFKGGEDEFHITKLFSKEIRNRLDEFHVPYEYMWRTIVIRSKSDRKVQMSFTTNIRIGCSDSTSSHSITLEIADPSVTPDNLLWFAAYYLENGWVIPIGEEQPTRTEESLI